MFCPKCGKSEQQENSYCRQCGTFLPDFTKIKKSATVEDNFKSNIALNVMSAIVSLGLAITLYAIFLGKNDTHFVIYLTAGFLTAMFFWQVQIFYRTLQLKKQFPQRNIHNQTITTEPNLLPKNNSFSTDKLLSEPDLKNYVPISVTENETEKLKVERK